MECSFGKSADFVLPETQKILAQCPKVRKVLFLPDSCPLECSTGPVERLTVEPWFFLQIRFSSEKPSIDVKLYLAPNKVLPKCSPGHVDSVLDTVVENFCHKSGITSLKIRIDSQSYFLGKKTRLSQSFSLDIWNAVLTTPSKRFRQETGSFTLLAQKSKSFGFCQNYFPEVLRSAGHVESLPGSSSFLFKILRTRTLRTRHRWWILFLGTWKFFAKSREKH